MLVPSSNISPTEVQIWDGEVLRFSDPYCLVVMLRISLRHTDNTEFTVAIPAFIKKRTSEKHPIAEER